MAQKNAVGGVNSSAVSTGHLNEVVNEVGGFNARALDATTDLKWNDLEDTIFDSSSEDDGDSEAAAAMLMKQLSRAETLTRMSESAPGAAMVPSSTGGGLEALQGHHGTGVLLGQPTMVGPMSPDLEVLRSSSTSSPPRDRIAAEATTPTTVARLTATISTALASSRTTPSEHCSRALSGARQLSTTASPSRTADGVGAARAIECGAQQLSTVTATSTSSSQATMYATLVPSDPVDICGISAISVRSDDMADAPTTVDDVTLVVTLKALLECIGGGHYSTRNQYYATVPVVRRLVLRHEGTLAINSVLARMLETGKFAHGAVVVCVPDILEFLTNEKAPIGQVKNMKSLYALMTDSRTHRTPQSSSTHQASTAHTYRSQSSMQSTAKATLPISSLSSTLCPPLGVLSAAQRRLCVEQVYQKLRAQWVGRDWRTDMVLRKDLLAACKAVLPAVDAQVANLSDCWATLDNQRPLQHSKGDWRKIVRDCMALAGTLGGQLLQEFTLANGVLRDFGGDQEAFDKSNGILFETSITASIHATHPSYWGVNFGLSFHDWFRGDTPVSVQEVAHVKDARPAPETFRTFRKTQALQHESTVYEGIIKRWKRTGLFGVLRADNFNGNNKVLLWDVNKGSWGSTEATTLGFRWCTVANTEKDRFGPPLRANGVGYTCPYTLATKAVDGVQRVLLDRHGEPSFVPANNPGDPIRVDDELWMTEQVKISFAESSTSAPMMQPEWLKSTVAHESFQFPFPADVDWVYPSLDHDVPVRGNPIGVVNNWSTLGSVPVRSGSRQGCALLVKIFYNKFPEVIDYEHLPVACDIGLYLPIKHLIYSITDVFKDADFRNFEMNRSLANHNLINRSLRQCKATLQVSTGTAYTDEMVCARINRWVSDEFQAPSEEATATNAAQRKSTLNKNATLAANAVASLVAGAATTLSELSNLPLPDTPSKPMPISFNTYKDFVGGATITHGPTEATVLAFLEAMHGRLWWREPVSPAVGAVCLLQANLRRMLRLHSIRPHFASIPSQYRRTFNGESETPTCHTRHDRSDAHSDSHSSSDRDGDATMMDDDGHDNDSDQDVRVLYERALKQLNILSRKNMRAFARINLLPFLELFHVPMYGMKTLYSKWFTPWFYKHYYVISPCGLPREKPHLITLRYIFSLHVKALDDSTMRGLLYAVQYGAPQSKPLQAFHTLLARWIPLLRECDYVFKKPKGNLDHDHLFTLLIQVWGMLTQFGCNTYSQGLLLAITDLRRLREIDHTGFRMLMRELVVLYAEDIEIMHSIVGHGGTGEKFDLADMFHEKIAGSLQQNFYLKSRDSESVRGAQVQRRPEVTEDGRFEREVKNTRALIQKVIRDLVHEGTSQVVDRDAILGRGVTEMWAANDTGDGEAGATTAGGYNVVEFSKTFGLFSPSTLGPPVLESLLPRVPEVAKAVRKNLCAKITNAESVISDLAEAVLPMLPDQNTDKTRKTNLSKMRALHKRPGSGATAALSAVDRIGKRQRSTTDTIPSQPNRDVVGSTGATAAGAAGGDGGDGGAAGAGAVT